MEDSEDEDDAGSVMDEEQQQQQQQARPSEPDPNMTGSQRQSFLALPPDVGGSDAAGDGGGGGGYAAQPRSPTAHVEALTGADGAPRLPLPQGDAKVRQRNLGRSADKLGA